MVENTISPRVGQMPSYWVRFGEALTAHRHSFDWESINSAHRFRVLALRMTSRIECNALKRATAGCTDLQAMGRGRFRAGLKCFFSSYLETSKVHAKLLSRGSSPKVAPPRKAKVDSVSQPACVGSKLVARVTMSSESLRWRSMHIDWRRTGTGPS